MAGLGVAALAAGVVSVTPATPGHAASAPATARTTQTLATTQAVGHARSGATYQRRITLDMRGCGTTSTGDTGGCVVSLQTWLNIEGGYDLEVDGVFGADTRRAVTEFQSRHQLPMVGMFGPRSRAALRAWWQDTMRNADASEDDPSVEGVSLHDSSSDLHTAMGEDLLWSIACQGAGAIAGWMTKNAGVGIAVGVICDVVIREGFDD